MSNGLLRAALGNPRVWSGLTVLLELSRAASYWFRPPEPGGVFENLIPYSYWTWILLLSSTLISVGSLSCKATRLALFGHMIGVFAYVTFGSSILLGAVFFGEGWASMGSLYVVSVLHFCLAIAVGDRLSARRQEEAAHER